MDYEQLGNIAQITMGESPAPGSCDDNETRHADSYRDARSLEIDTRDVRVFAMPHSR